jgi:hypothetical protein
LPGGNNEVDKMKVFCKPLFASEKLRRLEYLMAQNLLLQKKKPLLSKLELLIKPIREIDE